MEIERSQFEKHTNNAVGQGVLMGSKVVGTIFERVYKGMSPMIERYQQKVIGKVARELVSFVDTTTQKANTIYRSRARQPRIRRLAFS